MIPIRSSEEALGVIIAAILLALVVACLLFTDADAAPGDCVVLHAYDGVQKYFVGYACVFETGVCVISYQGYVGCYEASPLTLSDNIE